MRASRFVPLALFSASFAAHADSMTSFKFDSNLTDGYAAQGLVSVDTTDGEVQSSYFTLSQNGVVDATFTSDDYSQPLWSAYLAEFKDIKDGYTYELLLPTSSLANYKGGSVCTMINSCLGFPSGVYLPNGGSATALDGSLTAAETPEPASILMLGTGLLGGFLLSRRYAGQRNL